MEGFYRKQGGASELLVKEKERLFGGPDTFSLGEEKRKVFLSCRLPSLSIGRV